MSVGMKLILGVTVLVAVAVYVAFLGASSSWQYYLTVDECVANGPQFVGGQVRVSGRVTPGTLQVDEHRTLATFALFGTEGSLRASCRGPLPDNLAENMDVVVEGRLTEPGQLRGEKLLTKCASKYSSR